MSYDIYIVDKETKDHLYLDDNHNLKGGTYQVGGCSEAWLNITYNYSDHFSRVLGDKGIRSIYGMSSKKSIPILKEAAEKLDTNTDWDYWRSTEGNARLAIENLITLAELCKDGIWEGD